jgi:hypothetical protein
LNREGQSISIGTSPSIVKLTIRHDDQHREVRVQHVVVDDAPADQQDDAELRGDAEDDAADDVADPDLRRLRVGWTQDDVLDAQHERAARRPGRAAVRAAPVKD